MTAEQMIQTDTIKTEDIIAPTQRSAQYKTPPMGEPGVLEWMPVHKLEVDPAYQREHKASHAKSIAKNWDWSKIKALNVCIRDDGYYVVDGQHITIAARLRGDIKRLPAYITVDTKQSEEADMFLGIACNRKGITAYEKHRARLAAGHTDARLIENLTARYGVELTSKNTSKDRECGCVATLYAIESGYKKIGGLGYVLRVVSQCWWCSRFSLSNTFITGLVQVLHAAKGYIGEAELMDRLAKIDPETIIDEASAEYRAMSGQVTLRRVVALKIGASHDKLSRTTKLCPKLSAGK